MIISLVNRNIRSYLNTNSIYVGCMDLDDAKSHFRYLLKC